MERAHRLNPPQRARLGPAGPVRRRAALGGLGALALSGCTLVGAPAGGVAPVRPAPPPSSATAVVPRTEAPSRSGNMAEYEQNGRRYYVLDSSRGYAERGVASWYGERFHGRPTSSGEPYDMHALTAAHRTLPIPTYVRVTNLANGRSLVVRVNDRGPFSDPDNRLIDLSYAAAQQLDVVRDGTASVRIEAIEPWQSRVVR